MMLRSRFHIAFLILSLASSPLSAEPSEAFGKGQADGKVFGERTGRNKGTTAGQAKGEAEGFARGYEDARTQTPSSPPAPEPSPEPSPEPTPSSEPTPAPEPTSAPSPDPSGSPTPEPTASPSTEPVPEPTASTEPSPSDAPVPSPEPSTAALPDTAGPGSEDADTPPASSVAVDAGPLSSAVSGHRPPAANRAPLDDVEMEALQSYPDLMPPAASAVRGSAASLTTTDARSDESSGGFTDEEKTYAADYAKGFALGFADAAAKAYAQAHDDAYKTGWATGYQRGMSEYKRLHSASDGSAATPEQLLDLARRAALLGRNEEALRRLELVIAENGSGPVLEEALYRRAAVYYAMGEFKQALDSAVKLVMAAPDSGFADDAYFLQGACHERSKTGGLFGLFGRRNDSEARTAYEILVARYPTSSVRPDALWRLGQIHERNRRKADAIAAYRKVVAEHAGSAAAVRASARLAALGA